MVSAFTRRSQTMPLSVLSVPRNGSASGFAPLTRAERDVLLRNENALLTPRDVYSTLRHLFFRKAPDTVTSGSGAAAGTEAVGGAGAADAAADVDAAARLYAAPPGAKGGYSVVDPAAAPPAGRACVDEFRAQEYCMCNAAF